jgi:hypothetical protein
MFGDRRNPLPNPAKELEFNLLRHGLRLHYDNLQMLSTSLRIIGSDSGVAQTARQIEQLADRVCADLDALDAILPESIDEPDAPHDQYALPPSDARDLPRREGPGPTS